MSEKKSSVAQAKTLSWMLVFAVVYADIGTSIFYVPGILYLSIGNLATLAQIITTTVFISIALKYVEICDRCPDGGGVVTICRQAFSSWTALPLLGGSLITVDYFLTSAISGVSGLFYLATLYPGAKTFVLPACVALFTALIILNIIGMRESAQVTSWFAGLKILVTIALLGGAAIWLTRRSDWVGLFSSVVHPGVPLTAAALFTGYADTWLAYSGLESAAQVSGAMTPPVKKTAFKAMLLIIIAIAVFSPPITAAALHILPESVKHGDPESLMSALAFTTGGAGLGWITVISASTLLFMACNTAIVGNYHVNVRLADLGFAPAFLRRRHKRLGTPYISIILSGLIPLVIIFATRGSIAALGDLYAFGLLGTLTLSSAAIDKLRWRDGMRGTKFWFGILTTIAVSTAWIINIFHKPHALFFGGAVTAIFMVTGLRHRRLAMIQAEKDFILAESWAANAPETETLLTLEEAIEARTVEGSTVLVSLRYLNHHLLDTVAFQAKGAGQHNAYIIFVDEVPGLFVPMEAVPSDDARLVLNDAAQYLASHGITGLPIWRIAEDAGYAVAEAARKLDVTTVFVGSSKRTLFWRMIRGRILKRLAEALPDSCRLIVVG